MCFIGMSLVAVGGFFMWYLWAFYQKSSRMDQWVATPCVIERAVIDDSQLTQHYHTKYTLEIAYRYQFDGQPFVSTQFKRIPPEDSDKKKISALVEAYPEGSQALCYVDPSDPSSAVLKKDTKASIYSIWFPGLFVLGGLGIIVSVLFKREA